MHWRKIQVYTEIFIRFETDLDLSRPWFSEIKVQNKWLSGLLCSGFWWWTFLDFCGLLWTFVDLWNFVESYGLCWTLVDFGEQNHFFLYNVLLHFPRNWVVWWDRMHFSSKVIKIGQFPSNSLDIMRYLMHAPTYVCNRYHLRIFQQLPHQMVA